MMGAHNQQSEHGMNGAPGHPSQGNPMGTCPDGFDPLRWGFSQQSELMDSANLTLQQIKL